MLECAKLVGKSAILPIKPRGIRVPIRNKGTKGTAPLQPPTRTEIHRGPALKITSVELFSNRALADIMPSRLHR